MKFDRSSLLLYAVTDRSWLASRTLLHDVEKALCGGAGMIQLREKDISYMAFLEEAFDIKALCQKYAVPFIINDDVDIAVQCKADGVHVGQHDMEAAEVRRRIGPDRILGVSVQTVEQAMAAQESGADYLGVGTVFPTSTKPDADAVSLTRLSEICAAVSIPVVAIGGITEDKVPALQGTGIAGIAVVSALFAQRDIESAAKRLRKLAEMAVIVP